MEAVSTCVKYVVTMRMLWYRLSGVADYFSYRDDEDGFGSAEDKTL